MISQLNSLGHDGFKICFQEKQTTSNQVFKQKQNISSLKGGREKTNHVKESYRKRSLQMCKEKTKTTLRKLYFPKSNKKTRRLKRQGCR